MAIWKKILAIVILIIIPIVIGLPFTLAFDNKTIMEVTLVVFGLFEFFIFMIRISLKDRRLYKKKSNNKEFRESDEYSKYTNIQYVLLVSGLINIILSVLYFYIFI